MGQAFDRDGNVLGEAYGSTKREVFDSLMKDHVDAAEIRIRSIEERMAERRELPQYQCHKVVRAAKITRIDHAPVGGMIRCAVGTTEHGWTLDQSFFDKHNPSVGGYYVLYEDGYASYSPAQAFEEGYTRIPTEGQTDGPAQVDKTTLQAAARAYVHRALIESGPAPTDKLHAALTILSVMS